MANPNEKIRTIRDGLKRFLELIGDALPITGTVAVTGVATADNQTNGDQLVQFVGPGPGHTPIGITGNALDVNVKSGLPASFGAAGWSGAAWEPLLEVAGRLQVDAAVNVITGFALESQLPAALVGGKLDVALADITTLEGSAADIQTNTENIHDDLTLVPVHAYDTFGLTNAFAAGVLEADVGDGAVVVPAGCFLSSLTIAVSALAGGAASLTWYLAHDAAGIIPITSPQTVTLATYLSLTAGTYVLGERLEVVYQRTGGAGPYLIAKVDAGTATIVGRLYNRPRVVG